MNKSDLTKRLAGTLKLTGREAEEAVNVIVGELRASRPVVNESRSGISAPSRSGSTRRTRAAILGPVS